MLLYRFLLFVTLAFLCTTGWWWAILPVAAWYVYVFDGYELLLLGALTDIHYGAASLIPYMTLLLTAVVVLGNWIKPRLMVYTTDTNV